jgi:type VI protein secretion system component VasK
VSWTFTEEELFRDVREYCQRRVECAEKIWKRKLFYLFTCHYCFSHYVTIFFVAITGYKLLANNWAGYIIALFALVWVANLYMSVYAWLRQQYKTQKFEAKAVEHEVKQKLEPSRIEFPPAA